MGLGDSTGGSLKNTTQGEKHQVPLIVHWNAQGINSQFAEYSRKKELENSILK